MPGLVGHEALRGSLRAHRGSYALVGPSGVGKQGVVAEWIGERSAEPLLPAGLGRAIQRPSLIHVLDAATVRDWSPFLRPLEDDLFPVCVIAEAPLPPAVASRLPIFRAGYLSEREVTQVLTERFPTLRPRPLLARLAEGSLDGIETLAASVQTFETLDRCLADGTPPDRRTDPLALVVTLRAVCRAVLGLSTLPISAVERSLIRAKDALEFLRAAVPTNRHEARNLLMLFLARFRRG